ncbi:hypothetical protein [Collimonas humicola]|uniref:hypothetical protein n=1 Tax=Collimonas humicola TaxID=2825886 RepID=UPI001B8BE041|nr:hypothetical protein [Collimonas humicola]
MTAALCAAFAASATTAANAAEIAFSSQSDFTEISLNIRDTYNGNPDSIELEVTLSQDAQQRMQAATSAALEQDLTVLIDGKAVSTSRVQSAIDAPQMRVSISRQAAIALLPTLLGVNGGASPPAARPAVTAIAPATNPEPLFAMPPVEAQAQQVVPPTVTDSAPEAAAAMTAMTAPEPGAPQTALPTAADPAPEAAAAMTAMTAPEPDAPQLTPPTAADPAPEAAAAMTAMTAPEPNAPMPPMLPIPPAPPDLGAAPAADPAPSALPQETVMAPAAVAAESAEPAVPLVAAPPPPPPQVPRWASGAWLPTSATPSPYAEIYSGDAVAISAHTVNALACNQARTHVLESSSQQVRLQIDPGSACIIDKIQVEQLRISPSATPGKVVISLYGPGDDMNGAPAIEGSYQRKP